MAENFNIILKTCISFSRLDPYAKNAAHLWYTLGLEKTGIKLKKKKMQARMVQCSETHTFEE